MQANPTAPDTTASGICVADGYGLRIYCSRRHLVVVDGYGSQRRERRFHRATHGLTRLILLGHTGYISLDAVRFLADTGIALIHIDTDGRVLATTVSLGSDQPALRRAQALAAGQLVGLEITRSILRQKIGGQSRVAADLASPQAGQQVATYLPQLEAANTLDGLRLAEAQAANTYFGLWAPVPVRFPTADQHRLPDHWTRVGPRRSPLSGGPQRAPNPANALLNYLYALLEGEARIACLTIGLDPGIGILHADAHHRDSLALDIMEAVRPDVDAYLLDLLRRHVFRASDFQETRQGACRILPPLTHELATTSPAWAERVAPITERVVRQLANAAPAPIRTSTPLTRTTLKAAVRRGQGTPRAARALQPPRPAPHCQECGTPIEPPHKRCADCHSQYLTYPDSPRLVRLTVLRAEGHDPAHGGDAARQRGRTNARHVRQATDWERTNPRPDPEEFRRSILPSLQHCSPQAMADATGLSYAYVTTIRKGGAVPHPRHWTLLRDVAASQPIPDGEPEDSGNTSQCLLRERE